MSEEKRKFLVHTAVITVGLVEIEAMPEMQDGKEGTGLYAKVVQKDNRYHAFILEVPDATQPISESQRNDLASLAAETLVEFVYLSQNGGVPPDAPPSAPIVGYANGGLLGGGEGQGSA